MRRFCQKRVKGQSRKLADHKQNIRVEYFKYKSIKVTGGGEKGGGGGQGERGVKRG
jgi:hypothetical protein